MTTYACMNVFLGVIFNLRLGQIDKPNTVRNVFYRFFCGFIFYRVFISFLKLVKKQNLQETLKNMYLLQGKLLFYGYVWHLSCLKWKVIFF